MNMKALLDYSDTSIYKNTEWNPYLIVILYLFYISAVMLIAYLYICCLINKSDLKIFS